MSQIRTRLLEWVVATVIAVVLGAVILVLQHGHFQTPRRALALAEVRQIEHAMEIYFRTYDRFPLQTHTNSDHRYPAEDESLARVLCKPTTNGENPEGLHFLVAGSTSDDGLILDSWDRPYHVMADWNLDGIIRIGDSNVLEQVLVWSTGKNGKDEQGAGDDLGSWY